MASNNGDRRLVAIDPDHHLWRNGRFWWTAFTVDVLPDAGHRMRRR